MHHNWPPGFAVWLALQGVAIGGSISFGLMWLTMRPYGEGRYVGMVAAVCAAVAVTTFAYGFVPQ